MKNLFEDIERGQNTAQCMSCFTIWKVNKKKSISRCPFCGHDDVIVTSSMW